MLKTQLTAASWTCRESVATGSHRRCDLQSPNTRIVANTGKTKRRWSVECISHHHGNSDQFSVHGQSKGSLRRETEKHPCATLPRRLRAKLSEGRGLERDGQGDRRAKMSTISKQAVHSIRDNRRWHGGKVT
ncbi:uncharacterized protein SPSK_03723 [Sporothrix schenckii 1099-18]|uniref:Uncharacterized protein n=1 Tax=Sporothrix schenckii 1099-18 TaxID=1397361 RepID=A0A0F2M1A6_SPOSC|nr:uncharacterized protein SPSK_03723 [Sporothrix schenckii 1099-18]KJR81931.1 hypothetical protein SPSK_03723 [Sporothrix schenckii 1099-18]